MLPPLFNIHHLHIHNKCKCTDFMSPHFEDIPISLAHIHIHRFIYIYIGTCTKHVNFILKKKNHRIMTGHFSPEFYYNTIQQLTQKITEMSRKQITVPTDMVRSLDQYHKMPHPKLTHPYWCFIIK